MMNPLIRLFAILFCVLACNSTVLSKEWRGITPLHSTRYEVQRRFGVPAKNAPDALYYNFPDEIAVVSLQNYSCDGPLGRFGIGWNVPKDTVIDIGIIPKRTLRNDRFLVGTNFKTVSANSGFFYYVDEEGGLEIETYKGTVTLVTYFPAASEVHRRCPRVQECCLDNFPTFDQYARLPFEDEKARLDNFVIQMREMMNRGAIVIYGKNAVARHNLLKRAQRAKRYLVQRRGLEPQRLLIVDGGYNEASFTELRLYMIGGDAHRIYLFPQKDPGKRSNSLDRSGERNERMKDEL